MGPQMSSAPPTLWVLGCLALVLWLWVLCTACHRKQARRQQAELQGSVMQVSARLSPGPGRGQQGTNQPSLPPVTATAEATAPLLPQQVGHQIA